MAVDPHLEPVCRSINFRLHNDHLPAAVLGGIGNITGAMLGGLIIGMVEIFGAGYISGQYKDVFAFIILISVLYFKPTGIMGENIDDTRV